MGAKIIGRYRWVICGLLFLATTINYIDRQVLGILAPTLKDELKWNDIDYSNVVFSFQLAYAIGLLVVGGFMDRLGTRVGYAVAVSFWSLAAMAHACVGSLAGFCSARFALGLGEAGNFPAAIKTVAEWFPKRERALATGIFNAGSNVGATVAPMLVPWLTLSFGWRWAFLVTGALGFLWLALWLPLYRRPEAHPALSPDELAHIRSDPAEAEARIPWVGVWPHRETWAFALAKYLTDPIWWFYLFWVPDFLKRQHGIDLREVWLPLVVIYLVADVGSIGGGWLSSALLKRGWTPNRARKTAMLVCALCVMPIGFAPWAKDLWVAVALIAIAAAAHQGWSANLFTTVSDVFPRQAVGSVVGIGGMAGAIGGMFVAKAAGYVLECTGSYWTLFGIAGTAYLTALIVFHALVPRLEPLGADRFAHPSNRRD